jgi:hypothetical protein
MESVTEQEKKPGPGGRELKVKIENEDDGEHYSFEVQPDEHLHKVIERFYEHKLRRERRPDDRLRCEKGGEDVFPFEQLSFKRYLEEGHCPKLHWLFAGGTGGA